MPVYAKECGEKYTLKLVWLPFATVLIKLSSLLYSELNIEPCLNLFLGEWRDKLQRVME